MINPIGAVPPLLCLIFFVQQMDTKTQDRHAYAENKGKQSDDDISLL